METLLPTFVSSGIGGVIAAILLFKIVPDMLAAFRAEMAAERAACAATFNKLDERIVRVQESVDRVYRVVYPARYPVDPHPLVRPAGDRSE